MDKECGDIVVGDVYREKICSAMSSVEADAAYVSATIEVHC